MSPPHAHQPSAVSQLQVSVKEEPSPFAWTPCQFSGRKQKHRRVSWPCSTSSATLTPGASIDKDKLLQEKDQQIQELTTKLMQKEQMVEMLRFQLEIRTNGGLPESMVHVKVKQEPPDSCSSPPSLIHPPSPPFTPTEEMVAIKQEVIKEEIVSRTSLGLPQCAQTEHTCRFSQQQMMQKLLRPQECDIQKEESTNENKDRTLEDLQNLSEQQLKPEIHQPNHDVTERQQTRTLLGHQHTPQVRTDPRRSISDKHEEQPAQEVPLKLSPLPFPGVSNMSVPTRGFKAQARPNPGHRGQRLPGCRQSNPTAGLYCTSGTI